MPEQSQPTTPFLPALRRLLQLAGRYRAWLFLAIAVDLVQKDGLYRHLYELQFQETAAAGV